MSKGKRLHPVAIFFLFFAALKEFSFPLLAAFFFGRGATEWDFPFTTYFIIAGFLLLFVYGYLKWLTFTYEVTEDELKMRQGIFIKKRRFIRRERIYSIDITAGVLQRLFQLVAVKIETAGGGNEPEVWLSAVTKQEANQMKEQLLEKVILDIKEEDRHHFEAGDQPSVEKVWKLSSNHLLLAALTSSGVGIAFLAILAIATQLEGWIGEQLIIDSFGYLFQSSIIFIAGILLVVFLLSWIISIIGTLLKYGSFTIVQKRDELEITRGVLERRQLTLSTSRITAIRIVESILRQPFGLATVYVESAGGGSKDEQLSTVLFPLVRKKQLINELQQILPDYGFSYCLEPLPQRARLRYIIRKAVAGIFIAAVASFAFALPYGYLLPIFLGGCAIFFGNQQFKDGGIGKNERFLWISFRKVSKTLVIIPRKRIQAIELKQSLMQKLRGLQTVEVSILTSMTGKSFQLVDVSEEQKEEVLSWFSTIQKEG